MLHGLATVTPFHQSTVKACRYKALIVGVPADIPQNLPVLDFRLVVGQPFYQL